MTTIMACQLDYVHYVKLITSRDRFVSSASSVDLRATCAAHFLYLSHRLKHCKAPTPHYGLDTLLYLYIINLTVMKRLNASKPNRTVDAKTETLRQQGTLHPNPETVHDEAFRRDEFFDPRDLVQVRYEMLRRHQVDGEDVTKVAGAFGISRQAYYMTVAAFERKGIAGLFPRRRGPQRAHKCTDEVLDFVEQWRADTSAPETVSEAVRKRFGVEIHPRSLARALTRRKKKR
jgi:transposase